MSESSARRVDEVYESDVINVGTDHWPRFYRRGTTEFGIDNMLIPFAFPMPWGRAIWVFYDNNDELTGQPLHLSMAQQRYTHIEPYSHWRERVQLSLVTPPEQLAEIIRQSESERLSHQQRQIQTVEPSQVEAGTSGITFRPTSATHTNQTSGVDQSEPSVNNRGCGTVVAQTTVQCTVTTTAATTTTQLSIVQAQMGQAQTNASQQISSSMTQTYPTTSENPNVIQSTPSSPPTTSSTPHSPTPGVHEPLTSTPCEKESTKKRKFDQVSPGLTPSPVKTRPRLDDSSITKSDIVSEETEESCTSSSTQFHTAMDETALLIDSEDAQLKNKQLLHVEKIQNMWKQDKPAVHNLRCNKKIAPSIKFACRVKDLPFLSNAISYFIMIADFLRTICKKADPDLMPDSLLEKISGTENEKFETPIVEVNRWSEALEMSLSEHISIGVVLRSFEGNSMEKEFYKFDQFSEVGLNFAKSYILREKDECDRIMEKSLSLGLPEYATPDPSWFEETGNSYLTRMSYYVEVPECRPIAGLPEKYSLTAFSFLLTSILLQEQVPDGTRVEVLEIYSSLIPTELKKVLDTVSKLLAKSRKLIERFMEKSKLGLYTIVETQSCEAIARQLAESGGHDMNYWLTFTTYMQKVVRNEKWFDNLNAEDCSKVDLIGLKKLIDLGFYEIQLIDFPVQSEYNYVFAEIKMQTDFLHVIRAVERQVVQLLIITCLRAKISEKADLASYRLTMEKTLDQFVYLLKQDMYSFLQESHPQLDEAQKRLEAMNVKPKKCKRKMLDKIGGSKIQTMERMAHFLRQDLDKKSQVVLLLLEHKKKLHYLCRTLDGEFRSLFPPGLEDILQNFDLESNGHLLYANLEKVIVTFTQQNRDAALNVIHVGTDTVEGGVLAIVIERLNLAGTISVTTIPVRLPLFYFADDSTLSTEDLLGECWNSAMNNMGHFAEKLGAIIDMEPEQQKQHHFIEWGFFAGDNGDLVLEVLCNYLKAAVARTRVDLERCVRDTRYAHVLRFLLNVSPERLSEIFVGLQETRAAFTKNELYQLIRTFKKREILRTFGFSEEEVTVYGHMFYWEGFEIDDEFRKARHLFNSLIPEALKDRLFTTLYPEQTIEEARSAFMNSIFNQKAQEDFPGSDVDTHMFYRCSNPNGFTSTDDSYNYACFGQEDSTKFHDNVFLYSFNQKKVTHYTCSHIFPEYLLRSFRRVFRELETIPPLGPDDFDTANYSCAQIAKMQCYILLLIHKYLREPIYIPWKYKPIGEFSWVKPISSFHVSLESFSEFYKFDPSTLLLQFAFLDLQTKYRVTGRLIKVYEMQERNITKKLEAAYSRLKINRITFGNTFVKFVILCTKPGNHPITEVAEQTPDISLIYKSTIRERRVQVYPCYPLGGFPFHFIKDTRFKEGNFDNSNISSANSTPSTSRTSISSR